MHEIALAQRILDEAKSQGAKHAFDVVVGELMGIQAEEIAEALYHLSSMQISVKEVISDVCCSCGYCGRAKILDRGHGYCLYTCPRCSKKPDVITGGEIKIVRID